MMSVSTTLCILVVSVLSLQASCQSLVAHVAMHGVKTKVTFQASGDNIRGAFNDSNNAVTGTWEVEIHPVWVNYDVADKCAINQLGAALDGKTANATTTTANNYAFTLTATTVSELEGKSVVLKKDAVIVCATIQLEGNYITAVAYLRKNVFGAVFFRQQAQNTIIVSDLKSYESFSDKSWVIIKSDVDCDNINSMNAFNPQNINSQSCSQNMQSECPIGSLKFKLGAPEIASGTNSKRTSYKDTNLPLSGDNSVVGKYLIIYDNNNINKTACAKIAVFKNRMASSTFNHDGITGNFEFKQASPFDPTMTTIHLKGLNNNAKGYHVHNFPVPVKSVENQNLCSADIVSGHLNPYNINIGNNYPVPTVGTDDLYETGDLSSKYGTFENKTEFGPSTFTDWNLPLFGKNSILGRSIVIHKNDNAASRWVCSNILSDGNVISAVAVFTTPVIGQIYFTQTLDIPETWIFARLNYFDGRQLTNGHKWQISTGKVGMDMSCASIGMMFNPSDIWKNDNSYATKCTANPIFCKLGDLSGRHGEIIVGVNTGSDMKAKAFFTDSSIRLSGPDSIIGRSVGIMNPSGSQLSCANVKMLHDLEMTAQLNSGNLDGKVMFSQKPGFGQIPTMVSLKDIKGFDEDLHRVEIRSHAVTKGDNPCSNSKLGDIFDPLKLSSTTTTAGRTHDQYKVGDLSRRGSLAEWSDFNLPMKGLSSIMGHSLAVLKQNAIVACAPINFHIDMDSKGYVVAAKSVFTDPVVGEIHLSQVFYDDESMSDMSLTVDLKSSNNVDSLNHNWHVHQTPIGDDALATPGRCASAGPHYDPFRTKLGAAAANYSTQCGKLTPLRCEVGDQAMKLGTYSLGSGAYVFTDVYLHLEGEYSVQGRSIVVHTEEKGAPRLACADIIPKDSGIEVEVKFKTPQNFSKRKAAETFAMAIKTEKYNVVVELLSQSDGMTMVNVHFLGKNRNLFRSQFLSFISRDSNRQTLGDYSTISRVNNASLITSSFAVLLYSYLIKTLLV